MMPLWTPTTSEPISSMSLALMWGWALVWLGSPWVAQRVWPMPQQPGMVFPASVFSMRFFSLPVALTTAVGAVPSRTARPAES